MPTLALLGVTWAVALALIPVAATTLGGTAAFALFLVSFSVFAVGECLHAQCRRRSWSILPTTG